MWWNQDDVWSKRWNGKVFFNGTLKNTNKKCFTRHWYYIFLSTIQNKWEQYARPYSVQLSNWKRNNFVRRFRLFRLSILCFLSNLDTQFSFFSNRTFVVYRALSNDTYFIFNKSENLCEKYFSNDTKYEIFTCKTMLKSNGI